MDRRSLIAAWTLPLMAAAPLLGAAKPAPSTPAPVPPTILVLPLDVEGTLSELGYAFALRMLEVLRTTGGNNLVHPKMLARVEARYDHRLRRMPPPERRKNLARILGAHVILYGTLNERQNWVDLAVETMTGAPITHRRAVADGFEALLEQLPRATVGVLKDAGLLAANSELPPVQLSAYATRYRQAMLDHAACHRALLAQPMGIGPPIVVDEAAIRIAMDSCQVALERDDLFASARADLALAHAFLGERKQAELILVEMKDTPGFHPTYWLARAWILARYYDPELALDSLREAIERHPGFMLGRGYLGEALLALGRPGEARAVFDAYLERSPRQSYVMGRIGLALQRSGDVSAAIDWTERALRETPDDAELLFQMGNRLIAADRSAEAVEVLSRIVAKGGARAAVYARLGRAQMLVSDFSGAKHSLRQAIDKAQGPSGWRTRNQARYELARLWMATGAPDNAIRQIRRTLLEGYVDRKALASPPLVQLQKLKAFKDLRSVRASPGVKPTFVSPLGRVSDSGTLVPRSRFERTTDRKVLDRL